MSENEEKNESQQEEGITILSTDNEASIMNNEEAVDELVAKVQDAIADEEQPHVVVNVFKRVMGLVLLLVGILGIVVAVMIYQSVLQFMDEASDGIDAALAETLTALDGAQSGLTTTSDTIGALGDTLTTAEVASLRVSQTLSDTQPLLDEAKAIVTQTVPDSLDTVQNTIPEMVAVAGVIDDTLATLSAFQYEQSVLGFDINFGLGVEYEPAIPFDVSIQQVGDSLDGVPQQMRDLGVEVDVTAGNLQLVSDDLEVISADIAAVNSNISELPVALNQINSSLTTTVDQIRNIRNGLPGQVDGLRRGMLIFTLWLGSFQLAPLYLGYELLTGKRD